LTLVQAWLTDAGIDLKTIGLLSMVQFPYTFKFFWSPLMDRYSLPFLGKRQGWMLVAQLGMFTSVAMLALYNPSKDVLMVSAVAVLISFFGASHDIVVDAYRRDILDDDELGFGASLASNAYLIGYRFLATVFGLAIADKCGWSTSFLVLAAFCLIGIVGTLIAPKPKKVQSPKNLREAVVLPFLNYLSRSGAVEMLIFLLAYSMGDNIASNLQVTFYLKMGYTKTEIAYASKIVGFTGMFVGGLAGGVMLFKYSLKKCLLWFGGLRAISILGFALMAQLVTAVWVNRIVLMGSVILFETLCIGACTAAYSAFMLKLCDRRFSATQFALLSSLMGISRVFIPSVAGYVAEPFGWPTFFVICASFAIPALLMIIFRYDKWQSSMPETEGA
jgi:MFS transporter, PAT family, beta-lactamase induction signal transducer AmpG